MSQIRGLAKLEKQLMSIDGKTRRGIRRGANMILERSKPQVPVDTGRLKRSGKVTKIKGGARISYEARNPKTGYNYAPIQHENKYFKHRVGNAKYLEKPVQDNIGLLKAMIRSEIK